MQALRESMRLAPRTDWPGGFLAPGHLARCDEAGPVWDEWVVINRHYALAGHVEKPPFRHVADLERSPSAGTLMAVLNQCKCGLPRRHTSPAWQKAHCTAR